MDSFLSYENAPFRKHAMASHYIAGGLGLFQCAWEFGSNHTRGHVLRNSNRCKRAYLHWANHHLPNPTIFGHSDELGDRDYSSGSGVLLH